MSVVIEDCLEVQVFDRLAKIIDSQNYHVFVCMIRTNLPDETKETEFGYAVIALPKPTIICHTHGNYMMFHKNLYQRKMSSLYYTHLDEQNILAEYCMKHGLPTTLPSEYPNTIACYMYSDDSLILGMHNTSHLMLAYEDFEKYSGFPHDEFCKIVISRILKNGFYFNHSDYIFPLISIEGGRYMNVEELLINTQLKQENWYYTLDNDV